MAVSTIFSADIARPLRPPSVLFTRHYARLSNSTFLNHQPRVVNFDAAYFVDLNIFAIVHKLQQLVWLIKSAELQHLA